MDQHLKGGYNPEVNTYDIILGNEVSRYSMLVVCKIWEFNFGRLDVHANVSTIGRYNYYSSKGYLDAMIRIFVYLKHHMKVHIICDTILLEDQEKFGIDLNYSDLYPDTVENISPDIIYLKRNPVSITTFLNTYHENDLKTRRYVTGVHIFLNSTPIQR